MAITSNYPGDLIIKLKSSNTIASVTFNEAKKLAAGDCKVYLAVGSAKLALSADPASHVLTFGSKKITYSNDDGYAVTLANV